MVEPGRDRHTKNVAIVDIDGVLADVRHRVHFVEQRPKNWKRFFAAAIHDEPHPEGLAVVETLAADHEIIFLTGRPEHLRADTTEWLARHGLDAHKLIMRADGDRGASRHFKLREVRRLARHREIAVVIDDDVSVIAAMRDAGFATLLADWETRDAREQASLFEAQEVEGRT